MRHARAFIGALGVWIMAMFEGARWSITRSNIAHSVQSARFEISASSRGEIVRRSQYFEENTDIVNRMADLFECYTVGCGLQLNPSSSSPEWNKRAKAWLDDWSQYPDISSLQSFGILQGLMARKWFVDGELFIVLVNGESNRPRLQLIEQHLVSTPPHLKEQEGKTVIDGIQIDPRGRPIGYYIADEDEKGKKIWGNPKPATMVIHLFEPTRPGQYRGLPFVYPVINTIHDLDDLRNLEMGKAKDAAKTTSVIKTKAGEMPSLSDIYKQKLTTSETISTGGTASVQREKYYQEVVGPEAVVLQRGDEMDQHKAESPSAATQWFWRNLKEEACSGTGMPYCLVYPETIQGTVYRGELDAAALWFCVRSTVIQDALRRIYQAHVMKWAVQNVPELRNGKPADWYKVTIRAPRAPNVDVGRNSAAMLAELAVGATNFERIYAPLGLDWREEMDKLKEQLEYAQDIGLVDLLAKFTAAQKPAAEPQRNGEPQKNGYRNGVAMAA
jgi:capsid protein